MRAGQGSRLAEAPGQEELLVAECDTRDSKGDQLDLGAGTHQLATRDRGSTAGLQRLDPFAELVDLVIELGESRVKCIGAGSSIGFRPPLMNSGVRASTVAASMPKRWSSSRRR